MESPDMGLPPVQAGIRKVPKAGGSPSVTLWPRKGFGHENKLVFIKWL